MSDPPTCITVAELRDLRSAEVRAQREWLIQQYAQAVKAHVLEVARNGYVDYARFWIVTPTVASVFLKHVTGLFYPWNSRNVVKTGLPSHDALLKRPIPAELIMELGEALGASFPDAAIELLESPIVLGCEFQRFLRVQW